MCDKDAEYDICCICNDINRVKVFERKSERGKLNVVLNDKTVEKMLNTLKEENSDVSKFIHKSPPYLYILKIFIKTRLIDGLLDEGYGDLEVSIGDDRVSSFKFILSYQNEMLKSLIDDLLRKDGLCLSEELNAGCFKYIHQFYSGKEITLHKDNIVDILFFCVCYSDHRLISSCMKCLKEIISDEIIIGIFKLIPYLNSPYLADLDSVLKEILSVNGNSLLLSPTLKELAIESVEYILKIPCLQIENEEKLLKSLILYYENIQQYYEDKNELNEDFKKRIIPNINWDRLNVEMLNETSCEIINEETMKEYQKEYSPLLNRIYILDFPEINDDKIVSETLKEYYYNCPNFQSINDETISYLRNEEIQKILKKYLRYKNIRFKIGCLLLIAHMKCEISYFISEEEYINLINEIVDEYSNGDENNHEIITYILMLYKQKRISDGLLNEIITREYLHESDYKRIKTNYKVSKMKLTNKYKNSPVFIKQIEYNLKVNENYSIRPIIKDLPEGLTLDRFTGIINGIPKYIQKSHKYEIQFENPTNKLSYELEIAVGKLTDFYYTKKEKYMRIRINNLYEDDNDTNNDNDCDCINDIDEDDYYFERISSPQLNIKVNEEIHLIPEYDGEECEFSIDPELPKGIELDKKTGIIQGKCLKPHKDTDYIITCKNETNELIQEILLSMGELKKFTFKDMNKDSHKSRCRNDGYYKSVSINKKCKINEEVHLIPEYDGEECEFSVDPDLPKGIELDRKTGIIQGKSSKFHKKAEYTITCKNETNELKQIIVISIGELTKFSYYIGNHITPKVNEEINMNPDYDGDGCYFSIYPSLPYGISLDNKTGIIKGKSSRPLKCAHYVVYCKNETNTLSFNLMITIGLFRSLSYAKNTFKFDIGQKVNIVPSCDGVDCLPSGLSLNRRTGAIQGKCSSPCRSSNYTVFCSNAANKLKCNITITVEKLSFFSYKDIGSNRFYSYSDYPEMFNISSSSSINKKIKIDEEIHLIAEYESEGCEFSVEPELPKGIELDKRTGIIKGKSSKPSKKTEYKITCRTKVNVLTSSILISIGELTMLKYNEQNKFCCYDSYFNSDSVMRQLSVGEDIRLIPEYDGEECEFSIDKKLPEGIDFNPETGIIKGRSSKPHKRTEYTITCKNETNELKRRLILSIEKDICFCYRNENKNEDRYSFDNIEIYKKKLKVDENIRLVPEVEGTEECEFSIDPELPEGIELDRKTGIIEGKCLKPSKRTLYTITCKNEEYELSYIIVLSIGELTNFSYKDIDKEEYQKKYGKHSSYNRCIIKNLKVDERILLLPEVEGCKEYEFSVKPALPEGIELDRKTGIIEGKCLKPLKKTLYKITCKGDVNKLKYKIELSVVVKGELTKFSYKDNHRKMDIMEYVVYGKIYRNLRINKTVNLIPEYDGEECEFSIDPELPEGIELDRKTGIIEGKCLKPLKKTLYTITCKNETNILKDQIIMSIGELTKFFYKDLDGEIYSADDLTSCTIIKTMNISDEIMLIPEYDGEECEFLVEPMQLPEGVELNTKTGVIKGRCLKPHKLTEYVIICRNETNQMCIGLNFSVGELTFFEYNSDKNNIRNTCYTDFDYNSDYNNDYDADDYDDDDSDNNDGEIEITELSVRMNEDIHLIPAIDGGDCEFSVNPKLPEGIELDRKTGIIQGKCSNLLKSVFTITCRNETNELFILLEISVGELSIFSYDKSNYEVNLYEEVRLIPEYDGDDCEFSIEPGIELDRKTGIIQGRCLNRYKETEYRITCKNKINQLETQFKLAVVGSLKFRYLYKDNNIKLNEYFEIIPQLYDNCHSFSISPSLPNGISIDSENGTIKGKSDVILKSTEYTISCECGSFKPIQQINLSIGGITHFIYPKQSNSFIFKVGEKSQIIPECDGLYCNYSCGKELPSGIGIDNKSGIITVFRNELLSLCVFKVICKNEINEMDYTVCISVEKNEIKKMGSRWDFDPKIALEKYIIKPQNNRIYSRNNFNSFSNEYIGINHYNSIFDSYQFNRYNDFNDYDDYFGRNSHNYYDSDSDNDCYYDSDEY